MTRAKPKPVGSFSSYFPIYAETCGVEDCGHAQSWHIGNSGGYLNGKMVPCRIPDCSCPSWRETWRSS